LSASNIIQLNDMHLPYRRFQNFRYGNNLHSNWIDEIVHWNLPPGLSTQFERATGICPIRRPSIEGCGTWRPNLVFRLEPGGMQPDARNAGTE